MKGVLSNIGRKLKRIFLGRIVVHELTGYHRPEPARIETHFRAAATEPVRSQPRVGAALFVQWKESKALAAGPVLGSGIKDTLRVESPPDIDRLASLKVHRLGSALKKRAAAKQGMWRIKRVPMTRSNRINYLKKQPKFEKTSLLALFSPLYQDRVCKSALDKKSGKLEFWYEEHRLKMGARYHLLLLRVFNAAEPLRWLWLPADKKLS